MWLPILTSLFVNRYGDFTSAISSLDFLEGRGLRAFAFGAGLIGTPDFFSFSQPQFNQLSLDFSLNVIGPCLVRQLFSKSKGELGMGALLANHLLADFLNLVGAQHSSEAGFKTFFDCVTGLPDCIHLDCPCA